jgi:peptidoglycan/LPS O-acetylase OafA/YrhL
MSVPVAGNTEHTAPENRVYFPALDGIRAVAFLLVFSQHYIALPWGWSGVNIFFVLSGFLITGILIDTRDTPHRFRNFYLRRTLRIFPLYYGIFLALLLLTPFLHWQWTAGWWAWPLYVGNFLRFTAPGLSGSVQQRAADAALFGPGILSLGHFWSLCVEEQFYLVWPWVVFRVRSTRALLWICATTVAVLPLLRIVTTHHAPTWMLNAELLYRFTPFQLDSLLLGGLLALLWRGGHRATLLTIARVVATICTIATVIYLAATVQISMIVTSQGFASYTYPAWKFTWGLSCINIYAGSLILCSLRPASWSYRIFHLSPVRWLGRISYGAYIFHDMAHRSFVDLSAYIGEHVPSLASHPQRLTVTFAFSATLLMSYLSYRFFEARFLNLKERWTR